MSLPAGGSVIHPAITRVLERRPVLAWAYDNDPKMHEQVRQLNVVLLVLAKHMPDQWLADRLLDDPMLLPTDYVLEQRQLEMSRRLRDAIAELTEDELRTNLGIAPALPPTADRGPGVLPVLRDLEQVAQAEVNRTRAAYDDTTQEDADLEYGDGFGGPS